MLSRTILYLVVTLLSSLPHLVHSQGGGRLLCRIPFFKKRLERICGGPSPTSAPSFLPTNLPTFMPIPSTQKLCFQNNTELKSAIESVGIDLKPNSRAAMLYGYPIGSWCFDKELTDMSELFYNNKVFNGDISNWDVSSAQNMTNMFYYSVFNKDISKWDVSSVQDMAFMFESSSFNQDLSKWIVSSVQHMQYMFSNSEFNKDLSKWDVSSAQNMAYMFSNSPFDQDISKWDVSSVQDMQRMFSNSPFNQDLSEWQVSSVLGMDEMFQNSAFNHDISKWDVSSVWSMSRMFYNAANFNQNLCPWGSKLSSSITSFVDDMFDSSACPFEDDPDLFAFPPGPFCFNC